MLTSTDPDYPCFHLAPARGRLNDPNGLVVADGVYHAFFQYGPGFPQDKLVHWGHASSEDLVHWRHHRPAIYPDSWYDRCGAYSGGAIVHDGDVWFHYTGNVKTDAGERESYQCLVTSSDLVTFVKDADNPLIAGPPPGYTAHFRDPQVVAEGDHWRMCIGAQRDDLTGCVLVYHSHDLRAWDLVGELELPDADGRFDSFGYMWECPNLLRIPDEVTGKYWDVLIFCPQGVGPIGDSFRNIFPCGYIIGEWDGRALRGAGEFVELDHGFEFYAPQTFARAGHEDAAPVLLGWLGNASEDDQPSLSEHGWVHTLSVPRRLTVRDGRLRQRIAAPDLDPSSATTAQRLAVAGSTMRDCAVEIAELTDQRSLVLDLEVDQSAASGWQLQLASGASEVTCHFEKGRLTVDRSATRYPHGGTRTISVPGDDRLRVQLVHDRSVTELFVGDGQAVFSLRSYLEPGEFTVSVATRGTLAVGSAAAITVS